MFKRVLFPTDFSEYADKTLEYVLKLKSTGVETVLLVHIMEAADEYPVTMARKERFTERLEETARLVREQGLQAEVLVELGKPYREILRLADERDASLIVIGCHGKGFLDEVVIGSVSDRVTREANVPVLLVKYKVHESDAGPQLENRSAEPFGKVLYPTDCSPCAQSALQFVRELKTVGCEEVIVSSVIDPKVVATANIDTAVKELESKLKVSVGTLQERGLQAKAVVPVGVPLEELLRIAKEERVSLVVMGSTGKGYFQEMLLGSLSENMIRKSKCPILVIHNDVCALQVD